MTAFPSKAISLDEDGRLRINRAAPKIKHAQITVTTTETKLQTGLANRRTLIIKPVQSGPDAGRKRVYIEIGLSGFTLGKGTPVWEKFELPLNVGPDLDIYAVIGKDVVGRDTMNLDVRVIEIEED